MNNLNAEIYYPPYLYDASGQPAARPSLLSAPDLLQLSLNPQFAAAVGAGDQISRVTLVRAGSVTHSTNLDQRSDVRFQDSARARFFAPRWGVSRSSRTGGGGALWTSVIKL